MPLKKFAKQQLWVKYKVAAEALGGSAWELWAMPEPDRSFWLYRGILWASAVAEAMDEDIIDRKINEAMS